MTQEQIIQSNQLIAEFMGIEFDPEIHLFYGYEWDEHNNGVPEYEVYYHQSWDWLIPVVEKIETIIFENDEYYNFQILGGCYVVIISSHGHELITVDNGQSKLECAYLAAVQFIEWYNQQ